jgi:hypothetical protein
VSEIEELCTAIINIGAVNGDQLSSALIINRLEEQFSNLKPRVEEMIDEPEFISDTLVCRIENEDSFIRRYADYSLSHSGATPSAFGVITPAENKGSKLKCSNCKRSNHTADFCIRSGGKIFGRTVEEARAAQRAASGMQKPSHGCKPLYALLGA